MSQTTTSAGSRAIEIRGVARWFDDVKTGGRYTAIQDVDLTVRPGEFLSIVGPSGCGKSTLLHMVAGFEPPSAGEIAVRGHRVDRPGADRGVVFQSELAVFPWLTVERNVEYGLRVRKVPAPQRQARVSDVLRLVGLEAHRDKYPRQLSGGMKQRVQIARVLANDPDCMLMDEPFGALDAQTRMRLQDELVRIWQAKVKTVVFVTHDVSEAVYLSDRVAVMSPGPAARVKSVVEVGLPRPRRRDDPEFLRLTSMLTSELHHEREDDDGRQ
ncbi:ABC transporter ATP-binding protein [Blastococcus deserti]|uniref:ABC transporter ATP-binding protein n=1 Tax=Blastococcus deserti TaxID=2259033 RepID=A0ABW4XEM1_9ACTN